MRVQIHLSNPIYNTLKELAIRDNVNVQEVIGRAIYTYLSHILPKKEGKNNV